MKLPYWYGRYSAWASTVRTSKVMWSALLGGSVALGAATAFVRARYGEDAVLGFLLSAIGWVLLVGGPVAALDAWAAGVARGQRIVPWVRLVAIAGVGVVGGACLLFLARG